MEKSENLFKENSSFFKRITLVYAIFYALCVYKNGHGIAFFVFAIASVVYYCLTLAKLEMKHEKGSWFYIGSIVLLSIATFMTADGFLIFFNKTGIFLLTMTLLIKNFFKTNHWDFEKYFGAIMEAIALSFGEIPEIFLNQHSEEKNEKANKVLGSVILGIVISIPLLIIVIFLLGSADIIFSKMINQLFRGVQIWDFVGIGFRVSFMFAAVFCIISFLTKRKIKEEVAEKSGADPIPAITVTSMLSLVYILFSFIQIFYLFMGNMQLPEGYTYAAYAREGFFQLLFVSILNFVIVMVCLKHVRENIALKIVLTVMSLCTFIMIASSALRLCIYIEFYFLTYLRVLVLFSLGLLFLLFVGVIIAIYKKSFNYFKYGVVVVTVCYLCLAFARPDFLIAKYNTDSRYWISITNNFDAGNRQYTDYPYLYSRSLDAAGFVFEYADNKGENLTDYYKESTAAVRLNRGGLKRMVEKTVIYGQRQNIRTFNISEYMAWKKLKSYVK